MNKLQTIREACIEANPEIVELKRGCYIKTRWNSDAEILGFSQRISARESAKWFKYMHGITVSTIKETSILEIIGRPITLADVLMAIEEKYKADVMYRDFLQKYVDPLVAKWNLSLPLSGQSETTLHFISTILSNE